MNNDMISRESIEKIVVGMLVKWSDGYSYIEIPTGDAIKEMKSAIDNAPTIDIRNNGACEDCVYFDRPPVLEPCRHCTLAYGSCFKEKEKVKDNRPTGEWVEKTFKTDDEEGTKIKAFVCSSCGASRIAGMGNAKFCYNCGAQMKGDTSHA